MPASRIPVILYYDPTSLGLAHLIMGHHSPPYFNQTAIPVDTATNTLIQTGETYPHARLPALWIDYGTLLTGPLATLRWMQSNCGFSSKSSHERCFVDEKLQVGVLLMEELITRVNWAGDDELVWRKLEEVDLELRDGREFWAGTDCFTVADAVLVNVLVVLERKGFKDWSEVPSLDNYKKRMYSLDFIGRVIDS